MSIGLDLDWTRFGLWRTLLDLDWIRTVIFFTNLGSGPDLDWDFGKFCINFVVDKLYFVNLLDLTWILILTKIWTLLGLGLKFKNSGLDLDRKTWEFAHLCCPPLYSCYRYDSVCRDCLLVRESERCHVLSWPNKHAWVAPRASWRASVPVHSLISKFIRRHLSGPLRNYL